MNELLHASGGVIARWLEAKLPALGSNWWIDNVVNRLTFQQQRLVAEKRIQSLLGLDLAAVLRVLDQNWSELAGVESLPREARNWIKELQSVRNRWAHSPAGGLSVSDSYRDADTLQRFLYVIKAGDALLSRIEEFKQATLSRMTPPSQASAVAPSSGPGQAALPASSAASTSVPTHKFSVGQLLCLRSNPGAVFPVLEVLSSVGAETRYRVFEGGARQIYYESQLQALDEPADSHKVLTAIELSAMLTAVQLSSPSASTLYSLNSGRVRFVPYQYRPIFKLIRADQPRLLVADEVGVGKTIEAGLILKELQARSDIKSVLVICPKALVAERKWELEMKRFDEHFVPFNGSLLRHCIKETHLSGEWPAQYEKVILPTSLFDSDLLFGKSGKGKSRDLGLLELDPPPKFDLVIVDEAHHIRNADTFLHQAVRYFADNADAVVFLSATPVQLGREDLYTLLNVLRPDVIIDPASFNQMAEPNQFINSGIQACRRGSSGWTEEVREQLRGVVSTTWGREVLAVNPGFQHIYDGLAEGAEDGAARIKTIQALEDLYTFSSLINRTRRRDIGEFTIRKAESVTTDFTPSQKSLHDDLLSVIARIFARLHGNQNVKFMMSTVSRQAASSLYGLAPALEDILQGKLARLEAEDDGEDVEERSFDFVDQIRGDIESLVERARRLDPKDPKAEAFMQVVTDKLAMPRNKVLVFSTFRHTLHYLVGKLKAADIRFGLVHGGVSDEDRAMLRRRFSLPKADEDAIDVLLSSEVGCEGLDFQFCDCLINFDLPWNPMRIEQRIGRIDRYGQQSEAVGIFNLVTPGTIDAEIYDRCLSRIGVFQHAIGGNEEILGDITRELHSIAETFSLSEEERAQQLQQLSDNKIRQIEEEQRLEERQGELFGLNIAAASWEQRLAQARNHWLEPHALSRAVASYLSRLLGKEQDFLLGDKSLKTLRLSQEARVRLLEDFRKLPRSTDPMHRGWDRWLKGTVPTLQVTFEQECAVENPSAVLLSLGHPLLRQAAVFLEESEAVIVKVSTMHETLPAGRHPFALYRWHRQGVKRDEELVPVAAEASVAEALLELLQGATDEPDVEVPSQQVWDELDGVHHQLWLAKSTQHSEDNRQLVGVRIQSLTASFTARKALLEEQIGRATNDKIRVMKQAELERGQVNFDMRIAALRQAAESGDIRATPAVFGILEVRRPA
ncbi:helicase-related protein [Pseudomonas sp. 14A]|uniref:DEAD/DEAH box helicase n=1 Tax=Pseudomonas sp. 14A TaxID=2823142 RepID=UPI001B834467|nr:helicase-related protein [Pseudomonas sp. 14A]MBR7195888.1 DEAD/DEAH box helicase family protein [Pseudomonas sp. 14A]